MGLVDLLLAVSARLRAVAAEEERKMVCDIETTHVTKEWVAQHCRCVKQEKTRHLLCPESCPIHNSFIQYTYPGVQLAIDRVTTELRWKRHWEQAEQRA